MALLRRKTLVELCVTAAVLVVYFSVTLALSGASAEVKNDFVPVQGENTVSDGQDEHKKFEEKPSPPEFIFSRFEAREINDGEALPRDTYDLPRPETERSSEFRSFVSECCEKKEIKDCFDNAVFLGDSVTLGLQKYVTKMRRSDSEFCGNVQFIAVGSYGVYEATRPVSSPKNIHKTVDGEPKTPDAILALYNADKVYICLGLNDVGIYTKEDYFEYYSKLILAIRSQMPEIKIIIESITPITLYGEKKLLYNKKIDDVNLELARFAKENGCIFFDISDMLKDTEGYLAYELSSDNYCHLEDEAYAMWIDYIMRHEV